MKKALLFGLQFFTLTALAQSGYYVFDGAGNCPNQDPYLSWVPAGYTWSAFSGTNISCVAADSVYASNGWNTTSSVNLNQYCGYSISAQSCCTFTLQDFWMQAGVNSGTTAWHVRSSVDNFAADLGSGTITTTMTGIAFPLAPADFSFLSAVEFRIYFTGLNDPSTVVEIDNVHNFTSLQAPLNTFYMDVDMDGYGDPSHPVMECTFGPGYVLDNTDCDDQDPTVHPGAMEVCDGIDNNCDGIIDNVPFGGNTYYADADGDGYGDASNSVYRCSAPAGYVSNSTDCNDNNRYVYPGAPEICDGLDNDCNNSIDDNTVSITWYVDADGDGYGSWSSTLNSCTQPAGYVRNSSDCNDANANVHPGATEICNGIDDNCDASIDNIAAFGGPMWYADNDADGYGDPYNHVYACSQPSGYVADFTDCNDFDATKHPGAVEVCNGDDDDCDGIVDNVLSGSFTWFQDMDNDGYGNASVRFIACYAPSGYTADSTYCNDHNANIHPGAIDIPNNSIDEDCNGIDSVMTGISTLNSNGTVLLFPNPGSGSFTLLPDGSWHGDLLVQLYSSEGKFIAGKNFSSAGGKILFDTTDLPAGVYFITMMDATHSEQLRWIKL